MAGAVPLVHSRCYVIKLHGDYLDTRIRNTESELATYSPQLNQLLDRIFDEYGLIVSGWSGEWDDALRSRIVRAPNRRYSLYWSGRGTPKPIAEDILRHRAGRFIAITDADTFWTNLAAKVAVQMDLQRANPRSIKLLTATAKKYLASVDHRIELDDLVRQELNRALALVAAEQFETSGPADGALLARRAGRYEAIFEPLAKIFATIGRWGGKTEFQTAADVIVSLADQEIIGGSTVLIALRYYPAMLLAYGYGLGSLRAGQLARIHSLFRLPLKDGNGRRAAFVTRLFLDAWDGAGRDVWNHLPEFPQHNQKTPLSDHLHGLFQQWLGVDIFLPKEYTAAFEEFELIGSLAFLSIETNEQKLDSMIADEMGHQWIWIPMGRIGWRGAGARPVVEKWRTAEGRRALLDAGFADGSVQLFDKSMACLAKRMGRMSY